MFKGTLAWASNFAPVQVTLDGLVFPSVEHGYQASKTDNPRLRLVIANAGLAADARRLGKRLTLSLDWEQQRDIVMFDLLKQKFSTPKYMELLLLTGDEYLCEWNTWGDRYWGRDIRTGQGENHLGRMLMSLRRMIQTGQL
jgi:ribA/ribD-fused uncharacterized protein